MAKHIGSFHDLIEKAGYVTGMGAEDATYQEAVQRPVVVHCLDATYPVTDVHMMPDGSIGIEIALHETGEECNCQERGNAR